MQSGEPILLLCHAFPPVAGIGGRRWAKFAKELARRGHTVHVVRSETPADGKESLWADDVRHPNIIHHPIPARFPEVMTRWPLTSVWDKLMYRAWLRILPLRTKGNYYDAACLSRKDVLREASRLIREHGIRQVVATGAPFHILVFGAEIKKRFPDVHLVVDIRDEWVSGRHYGLASISQRRRRVEQEFEATVVQMADVVTSPHETVLAYLKRTYGKRSGQAILLPHAVDPDEFDSNTTIGQEGRFRMMYAGSLYGEKEAEHYFQTLLEALSSLRQDAPAHFTRCSLDLYITSPNTSVPVQRVQEHGMADHVHFHAPLPPKAIFHRLAMADLVLTFIPSKNKDILGTKFHEVFYLRRPILHIGEPGLVSRTILERRLGDSVRVEELATELPRIIRGERKIEIDTEADHSEFLLGPVTDRLINEVLV